ncbi:porin [Brevundimonas sp.]|uniref:porin n=1 Tax=Brevundimonas sp. TaxID=1871086 RepID=UPI0019BCDD7F|nr:porin [Brevundimonas sp.]MBD3836509.1 porin [Brevundimonas sp.]
MKTLFLASAAAAALFAAPALAQDAIGSVGLTYSNPSIEIAGEDFDADVWTVDGTVAIPANNWTVTFNGAIDYAKAYGEDDTTGAAAAHLTTMVAGDVRVGGFVAGNGIGSGDTVYTVGAEAQKYLAGSTLTGVVAYTSADDLDADIWTVGGDAAFYVMPNLRLNAGVSYNNVDAQFGDIDAWTYGVGGEYEFTGTPFSVAAGYTRADIDSIDVDTWSLGLRYSFGGGLQARDRAGAGLNVSSIASVLGGL